LHGERAVRLCTLVAFEAGVPERATHSGVSKPLKNSFESFDALLGTNGKI